MREGCEELERRLLDGHPGGEAVGDGGREHLAGCADCRAQVEADGLLRQALEEPRPRLGTDFEARLRGRLEERASGRPTARRRPGALGRSGWWALGGYATAAAAASLAILVRLPWDALSPSPLLAVLAAAAVLLSPLVLVDRLGVVRPPG